MRATVLLAAAALLLGCGADLRRAGDGGAASATDLPAADAPPRCPPRVAAGLPCASGALPCLGEDRCNDCFCTTGVWVCGSRVCVDAGACPTARPRSGDPCASAGQACAYGAGCAGADCVCAGGRWSCSAFYCSDR